MKKLFSLAMLAMLTLTALRCHRGGEDPKPEDELPPATQEGKNTFGCLLNGKAWLPGGNLPSSTPKLEVIYDGSTIQVYARKSFSDKTSEFTGLYLWGVNKTGEYTFSEDVYAKIKTRTDCIYEKKNVEYSKGKIKITKLDTERGIISGEFEFEIYEAECVDTIKVTKGRFDYNLK